MPAVQAKNSTTERTSEVYRTAAELIVDKGFGGTSIGDIATAVGMTKASLYHHISGKQDMLYQIMQHAMDELERTVIVPVRLIEDPEQRLREIMRLHIMGAIEHGVAITIVMSEISHLEPDQRQDIIKRRKAYHALARQALRQLADQGRLRDLDVNIATMHIMNTLVGIARWYPNDITSNQTRLIRETVEYNVAAILKTTS
ncbi:MAG: TetR/AcrR family transcriptional regulator [Fuerstiella sp.]|nr:TetR/AcrR family transcriptional regulator [Fuerstiella sp.]